MKRHIALLLAATWVPLAGVAQAAVPVPQMTGPLPVSDSSFPLLAADRTQSPIDLSARGYVEEEFLVSGSANIYDWSRDGRLSVRNTGVPYTTRILVRKPANHAAFSGNVIVETVNNARDYDWAFIWALSFDYFLDRGDAFVAVTHNPGGINALKTFDPVRYAQLSFANPAPAETCGPNNTTSDSEEGLKWDMISQVGALLKSGAGPLRGFDVERVYATTHTRELTTYANSVYKEARLTDGSFVYDGFVIKSEYAPADPIRRCGEATGVGDQRRTVRNAGVPVIRLTAQGDVLRTHVVRRDDSDSQGDQYRLWEVAGAPHMDKIFYEHMPVVADQVKAGQTGYLFNWPMAYAFTPDVDLLDFPVMRYAVNNAFAAVDRWSREGTAPPRAERIGLVGANTADVAFAADEYGNAVGGMRSVYVDVPVATYHTNSPGPAVCGNLGRMVPFSWPRLEALYGEPDNYVLRVNESLEDLVGQGWLLPRDSQAIREALTRGFSAE